MSRPQLTRPLLVRCARNEDAPALHAACFPEQEVEWVADYLAWCLATPERPARLVALLEDRLVAHVEMTRRQGGQWAELSSLVVAASERGLGLGHRVVGAARRLARRWGCHELRLQVKANDQGLITMYCRWGFHPNGTPLAGRRWLVLPLPESLPPLSESAPSPNVSLHLP